MLFVYLGAIARDISNNTSESLRIAVEAERIPERQIPMNPQNAAKVFLAYYEGVSDRPFRWMCSRGEGRLH